MEASREVIGETELVDEVYYVMNGVRFSSLRPIEVPLSLAR